MDLECLTFFWVCYSSIRTGTRARGSKMIKIDSGPKRSGYLREILMLGYLDLDK